MAYTKQTWDTTSYVNPTRMNHIEDGIADSVPSTNFSYLGAKNLNSTPYFHGTSRENNGVTFTVNADGSISTSGTATGGNAQFQCHPRTQSSATGLVLPNGDYILSGCASGGSSTKYFIQALRTSNGSANVYGYDYGSGKEITLNGDDYSNDEVNLGIYINVQNGQNANGLVFRPMIRLKGDNDSSWKPYAMTNQELTTRHKEIAILEGTLADSSNYSAVCSLPSGFTIDNSVVLSFQVLTSDGDWRTGTGVTSSTFYRLFSSMNGNGVKIYNNDSSLYGKAFKIALARY